MRWYKYTHALLLAPAGTGTPACMSSWYNKGAYCATRRTILTSHRRFCHQYPRRLCTATHRTIPPSVPERVGR
eukprot:3760548-Rhodomonas_salina.1